MSVVEPIKDLINIKQIEKILSSYHPKYAMLFNLGINSGLRISDILALNVSNVRNKQFIELYEIKTQKFKKFPINSKLKTLIDIYTQNRNPNEPLFMTNRKNRMDRITVYKVLNRACKEAHLEMSIGTHTLRKTFGYHFYKKFKDIAMLQKIYNHSSQQITLRYIGIEQEQIDNCYLEFVL